MDKSNAINNERSSGSADGCEIRLVMSDTGPRLGSETTWVTNARATRPHLVVSDRSGYGSGRATTPSSASHPGQCDKDESGVETLGSGTEIDVKRESLLC